MRLFCMWHRRRIARHLIEGERILPGSSTAQHISVCEECARSRQDYAMLHDALPASSRAPALSAGFDDRLRARLHAEMLSRLRSPARSRAIAPFMRAAAAAAALTVVGIGVALLRLNEAATTPGAVWSKVAALAPSDRREDGSGPRLPRGKPAATPRSAKPPTARSGAIRHIKRDPGRRTIAWRGRHRGHRRYSLRPGMQHTLHSFAAGTGSGSNAGSSRLQAQSSPMGTTLNVSATWRDVGVTYEAYGDYCRAARAFGDAFARERDAELAIAASLNAARSGDRSEALEYIAEALRQGNGEAEQEHRHQEEGL